MSTIAVVQKNSSICIVSESLTTFGSTKLDGSFKFGDSKILQWGNSLIGIVGDVAMKMIFLDLIETREEPDFSSRMAVFRFFTALHKELKEEYYINPNEEEDDPVESSQYEIVIANKHGIFGVHSLREVYHFNKYWAYGSGRDFALGAMHALYEQDEMTARQIAIAGVSAGMTFDDGSGGKLQVHTVELE